MPPPPPLRLISYWFHVLVAFVCTKIVCKDVFWVNLKCFLFVGGYQGVESIARIWQTVDSRWTCHISALLLRFWTLFNLVLFFALFMTWVDDMFCSNMVIPIYLYNYLFLEACIFIEIYISIEYSILKSLKNMFDAISTAFTTLNK